MPPIPQGHLHSEIDRRRQLGVKALDEKLAKMKNLPIYNAESNNDTLINLQNTEINNEKEEKVVYNSI